MSALLLALVICQGVDEELFDALPDKDTCYKHFCNAYYHKQHVKWLMDNIGGNRWKSECALEYYEVLEEFWNTAYRAKWEYTSDKTRLRYLRHCESMVRPIDWIHGQFVLPPPLVEVKKD